MSDKFTEIAEARREFAELWDELEEILHYDDLGWSKAWNAYYAAGKRVLRLMGYTDTVPPHYRGCLPNTHPDYTAYTLEELP